MIQNMIVGRDRLGKELRCGDICSFQIIMTGSRKSDEQLKTMKGMIVYDDDYYGYMFVTLDDTAPMIAMHVAEQGSIEYEVSVKNEGFIYRDGNGATREATYCNEELSAKWHQLYRAHIE